MKKLLSILTLLVAIVTGASAEDISCSAQVPTGQTGTFSNTTGLAQTNCTLYYSGLQGDGNKVTISSVDYYKLSSASAYVQLKLSEGSFQAGDEVSAVVARNSSSGTVVLSLKSDGGNKFNEGTASPTATTTITKTLVAGDIEADGSIKIFRGGNSNVRVAVFSVTGTRSGKTQLVGAWSAAAPTFDTGSSATIPTFALTNDPAVAAENYTITYSLQSGTLATVNAGTGITAINTEAAGTATVRATLALTAAGEEAYELPSPAYYDCVITVAAPKVATPSLVIPVGSYDYEKGGYKFQVSCATEDVSYSYKLKGAASFTELTTYSEGGKDYIYMVGDGSKHIIIKASKDGLADSDEVEINKWDSSNEFVLNVAPSATSPESIVTFSTNADQYDKDQLHQYRSFNVAGTYIAGIDGSDGLKMRCNRTFTIDETNIQGFALAVTPGYKITKVQITKLISNRAGTIEADAMYVDGSAYAGFESFTIPASTGTAVTKTYDGLNATSQIAWKLTPGTYGGSTTVDQFRFKVTITYEKTTENISFTDVATYVTTNALDFSEVTEFKAYAVESVAGGKANTRTVGQVPAGTALLLKADGAVNVNVPVVADADPITNLLQASDGSVTGDGSTIFAYSKSGSEFRLVGNTVTIPAGKAYLEITGGGLLSFGVNFEETTAVQNVEAAPAANEAQVGQKAFVNGHLVIFTEKGYVNALGQTVK